MNEKLKQKRVKERERNEKEGPPPQAFQEHETHEEKKEKNSKEAIHAFLSFVLHDYYKNIDQSDLVFFNENDLKEKYHYREAKSVLTKILCLSAS